jgi:REP element-mobilizing transposase RayT
MPRRRPRQLALELKPVFGWGGARPGAGRPRGPRPRVWHRERAAFKGLLPCHVTLRVRPDVPSLRTVRFVRAFERTLGRGSERGEFRVLHYSLQNDHAHFLVEATHRFALARGMKSLGARLALAANRVFERQGAVLDGRYHHRLLRTPREVRNAIRYVLLNARRHLLKRGARLPVGAGIDPASSGRWFDGWTQDVRLPASGGREPCVAMPRTWLARVGWRRHGRIDPLSIDPR